MAVCYIVQVWCLCGLSRRGTQNFFVSTVKHIAIVNREWWQPWQSQFSQVRAQVGWVCQVRECGLQIWPLWQIMWALKKVQTWSTKSEHYQEGEVVETLTRRRIDLSALKETRWGGGLCKSQKKMLTGKDSDDKFFCTVNKEGKGGVGILLAECWMRTYLTCFA